MPHRASPHPTHERDSPAALELDSVAVEIAGSQILHDISLSVRTGEVVSVVGPSGCGKTTLLNVVAGLVPVSAGTATVDSAPITGPGPDRTVVFQEDAVFSWMTVAQNVAYALALRRTPADEQRRTVTDLLELVGLGGRGAAWPKELSGGMRKRVDLARAFAARPKVLLMDEPYAALDQMTKQRLQQEFRNVVLSRTTTSMFVTHDLEEAIYVADRIVVMSASPGRIAAVHDVPFGRDRSPGIRTSAAFQDLRRTLMAAFEEAEAA
jgi:NitT/TauT family transport system ATP-binding protein